MMLKYSFGLLEESKAIDEAINKVLDEGYRTGDIMSDGMKQVTCSEMGDLVAERI
jgi:3-isopropylmalate dehydrogenase